MNGLLLFSRKDYGVLPRFSLLSVYLEFRVSTRQFYVIFQTIFWERDGETLMLEIWFVKCPYLQMVSINNPAIRVGFIPNTMEYHARISF